jgi:hypothetical protein
MSDSFDRYVTWLDFSQHERAPGYYGLLRLEPFEADLDRIQHALFQESMSVSGFLRGPQRSLAEAVLEEINRAEGFLTDPASKADYDALLRTSLSSFEDLPDGPIDERLPEPEQEEEEEPPIRLVEIAPQIPEAAVARPAPFEEKVPGRSPSDQIAASSPVEALAAEHPPRPRAAAGKPSRDNSAASVADRSVWEAIQQTRRRTGHETPKKDAGHRPSAPLPAASDAAAAKPPGQPQESAGISLSSAVASELARHIPAPLVKHRWRIMAASLAVIGLGFALQWTSAALDTPRSPRPRIDLSPEEGVLMSEQISLLYDLGQDTATRATAAEKLRSASPDAVRKFAYRLGDLASRQPEESIQQTLREILQNAGAGS